MVRPVKKEIKIDPDWYETSTNDKNKGYNEACDDWEKWLENNKGERDEL